MLKLADMMLTWVDLVDVLLLPSLVPAILYLSNQLWTNGPQGQRAIIRILQLILRPTSISVEASTMLSSVLNIVAKPLEHALRSYQRQDPKAQEVEPLLKALKENIPLSRRTGGAGHNELELWTGAHGPSGAPASGSLLSTIQHTVQNLIQWAQSPPVTGLPTPYTHRQMLAALKMLGAKQLLAVLLEELKSHNETESAGVAYDVVTAIVCALDANMEAATAAATAALQDTTGVFGAAAPPQRRMTLREALKAEADDWKRIQKMDAMMTETVVRLYRRVEAQMVPPPAPPPMLQPALGALGGDDIAIGDAIAAAAAAAGDHNVDAMSLDTTGLDGTGVDLGLGGAGDLGGLSATGSVGGLDGLSGDDLFSSLGGDFAADFASWESMELG